MPDHEETSEDPLQVIHDTLVCDDRDWSRDEPMAVIFGIACGWPTVLLAAKTYANASLNPPLPWVFHVRGSKKPLLAKTVRRCMA